MHKKIHVNHKNFEVNVDSDTPLLWVIREEIGLTGTKFGCGIGQCGACSVHVDGELLRSCMLPISAVTDKQKITTIEGLSPDSNHPVQKAWAQVDVQLKRRHDLIPRLVATVSGLRDHEARLQTQVAALRAQALAGFSATAITALATEQVGALSSSQVTALTAITPPSP